jgi:hypothetical protein
LGFALWIDRGNGVAWAQGTQEYRPMGSAAVALTDQFRLADFQQSRRCPPDLANAFAGFYGSLEEVNARLRERSSPWKLRATPFLASS